MKSETLQRLNRKANEARVEFDTEGKLVWFYHGQGDFGPILGAGTVSKELEVV